MRLLPDSRSGGPSVEALVDDISTALELMGTTGDSAVFVRAIQALDEAIKQMDHSPASKRVELIGSPRRMAALFRELAELTRTPGAGPPAGR
jgi:hypothetical protein